MKYISDIVSSFNDHFDIDHQKDFESSVIEFIISKYGIKFVVDTLTEKEFKRRHQIGHKTDTFVMKLLRNKKMEIKSEIESELKIYIREQKLNQIL